MIHLSGVQKIAVLLATVGEEGAAKVLGVFSPEEQDRIGQAMVELEDTDIDEGVVQDSLSEFRQMAQSGVVFRSRVGRTLDTVMNRLYSKEEAERRLSRIHEESRSRNPLRCLRGLRPGDLARLLTDEHVQVQALVLSNIETEQAADVLREMAPEQQADVVRRMAATEDPPVRLMKQVADRMAERTRGLPRDAGAAVDSGARVQTVAEILVASRGGTDKEILRLVEESDADLSMRIRERMFVWDDLQLLDKRTMQKLLAGVDTRVLALALKGSDDAIRDALLGATSQRTRDMILEERELLGSVPLSDVVEAQKQILTTVREMIDNGEVNVAKGRGAAYVS